MALVLTVNVNGMKSSYSLHVLTFASGEDLVIEVALARWLLLLSLLSWMSL